MKNNSNKRIIPMSVFKEAAVKCFKCQPDEIEIRMITGNKEAYVTHNGLGYKVSTRKVLREDIRFQLTNKDAVHHINFNLWLEATKQLFKMSQLIRPLIPILDNIDQAKMLMIAAGLASCADDQDTAFWEILLQIDNEGELLGNAMVTASREFGGKSLVDELTELHILNGDTVYNTFKGGIFEKVSIGDKKDEYPEFYIFSAEHHFE